jgi:uncharacterized protein YndB with AHSA1/START domain
MIDKSKKFEVGQMLIRKSASEVFEAFIDPSITKNFWFTKGSDKLEVNKKVTWEWEMYNLSTIAVAKEVLKNKKITIEWDEPPTTVDFYFKTLSDGSTYVTIEQSGFNKTGDELLEAIKDTTGGFTTVLDGLKAYLEHGINLNLIADKFPKEVTQHADNKNINN